ncbi:MAG: hypothetical protein KF875_03905 [Trueperaceae bacterium]|nr:hypothetical protein [Trueperaceae bacterium]
MTNVAQAQPKNRTQDLQQQLHDLQENIADLKARAEGHLDHGRTKDAMDLLARVATLRQHAQEVEADLSANAAPSFPSRRMSEAVTR